MPKPRFKHNIQTLIPISFLLLLTAVVIVVVYTTYYIVKPVLLGERIYSVEETGKSVASEINSMLAQAETAAILVGKTATGLCPNFQAIKETIPDIFNADALKEITAGGGVWPEPYQFDPRKDKFSFFWGRNGEGRLVLYDDYNVSGYRHEEWYVPVRYLDAQSVFWSRSYIDPYSHEPMVTCSAKMYRQGRFVGVSTVDLKLEGLKHLFARAAREISGYIFAVDRNNRFIVFPEEEYVLKKEDVKGKGSDQKYITSSELAKRYPEFLSINDHLEHINQQIIDLARKKAYIDTLAKEIEKNSYRIGSKEAVLIAALLQAPYGNNLLTPVNLETFQIKSDILYHKPATVFVFGLPETYWKLILTVPNAVMAAPVGRMTDHLVLSLSLLIVLVLVLAGLSLYFHILKPLRSLTNQLKKISEDSEDLSLELEIPANNELGELAYYFNKRTRELQNSEKKHRTIFREASEGISLSSICGDFIAVNPRFAEIFGYDSPEDLVKNVKTYELYANPADRERILSELKPGGGNVHAEVWLKKKDETPVLISLNLAPVTDDAGEISYLIAMVQDITRTKRLERELRHAQKMEAIGTLAGGIAHDFNNILAAISGFTELAQLKAQDQPKILSYLSQIEQASNRAKELIRQILRFSRHSKSLKEPQDFGKIVTEAVRLLRSTLPATIKIEPHVSPTSAVMAASSDLHQIVMNLCTNAYQAMRDKGGILKIRLEEREFDRQKASEHGLEPGKYAILEVEDTGCGMDEAVVAKIFEPYFTTKGKEDGTGLGLAIVHGIVKGLNGTISVKSTRGEGSLFTVVIPVYDACEIQEGQGQAQGQDVLVKGNGRKVMFVDDEEMLCSIFKAMLEEAGFDVQIFNNGKSALSAFKAHPTSWDLLITDMTMPRLSGADLIKGVRAFNRNLPIILCSGYSDLLTDDFIATFKVEFLSKPVSRRAIFRVLKRIFPEERAEK